jgi:hypothetical protein
MSAIKSEKPNKFLDQNTTEEDGYERDFINATEDNDTVVSDTVDEGEKLDDNFDYNYAGS